MSDEDRASIRIVAINDADDAVMTSSDFVATLPETNLQVEGRALVARTADATGNKVVLGEWPSVRIIGACVLYNHNLSALATWRLECWDGPGQTGSVVYDSTAVAALAPLGWGEFRWGVVPWGATVFSGWGSAYSVLWFVPVPVRSWRLTLLDASNADGYLQAKRLLMGLPFSPAVSAEFGLEMGWQDTSTQRRTQARSIRTDVGVMYRALSGSLERLDAVERASFMEACRVVGLRKEIFVSVFPEAGGAQERDYSLLGKFVRMPEGRHTDWGNWSNTFNIEEV